MVAPTLPKGSQEIVKDRLYFTSLRKNSPHVRKSSTSKMHYFTIDHELKYLPFFADFGPLNLGQLYRFCCMLSDKLSDAERSEKVVVFYCRAEPKKFANAAYLIGAFQIICMGRSAADAFAPFKDTSFIPFRDASMGPCHYQHTVEHCLKAIEKAKSHKFLDFQKFDVDDYEFYERVECGDFNVIVPGKFLAFSGPNNRTIDAEGYPALTPSHYVPIFSKIGVSTIVRLNRRCYDRRKFTDKGFTHFDLIYPDGTIPPPRILETFLEICASAEGIVAVHCKAGLGRTGTLIACYMMRFWGWTARECIAWIRICRPGSVIGPQQHYLLDREKDLLAQWKQDQGRPSIGHPAGSLMPRHLANSTERVASPTPTSVVSQRNSRRGLGRLTRDSNGTWSRQTGAPGKCDKISVGDLDFGDEDRFRTTPAAVLAALSSPMSMSFLNSARAGHSRAENTPRNYSVSPNAKPPRPKRGDVGHKRSSKSESQRTGSHTRHVHHVHHHHSSPHNRRSTSSKTTKSPKSASTAEVDKALAQTQLALDNTSIHGADATPPRGTDALQSRRYVLDGDRSVSVKSRSPAGLRPDQLSQGRYLLNAKRDAKQNSPQSLPISKDFTPTHRGRTSSMRPTPIHKLHLGSSTSPSAKTTNKDRSKSVAHTTTAISHDDLWSAVTSSPSNGKHATSGVVTENTKGVTSRPSVKARRRLFD